MRQILYTLLFIIIIDLTFQNCANPGRPSGGPRDTIPPSAIYSNPISGTTSFSESTIEIDFSEYINADKIKQQLIITPNSDITYKSLVKRNKVILKLEGELEDSTTYNFNFANGVTDITEKNPAVNLSIAFSTGPYIDSMKVNGKVEDLLSQENGKGFVVGLYPISDSLDFFTDKPMYFTTANDSGNYVLEYIKKGNYKIIAFDDDNGNFLLDPESESHGFIGDTLRLDSATTLPTIRCLLQNVKPIVLINARPSGRYVDIKFNKMISSYAIQPDISSNIIGEENDVIRLYKPVGVNFKDSLTSIVTASDSLGNQIIDTIKYVFLESARKPSPFSYSLNQSVYTPEESTNTILTFSKPIAEFDTTKITLKSDSLLSYPVSFTYVWNHNKTEVELAFNITQTLIDSLVQAITPTPIDTLETDTAQTPKPPSIPSISLFTETKAFISVENDSSTEKSIQIIKSQPISSGELNIELITQYKSFQLQLLDKNDNIAYEVRNETKINLNSVKACEYKIRILIDTNEDGTWSFGNLLKNQEPEKVFIYEEATSIRENWVVELSIQF